jgi:hypothetical protein
MKLFVLVLVAVSLGASSARNSDDPEAALAAAVHKEIVEGEPGVAIDGYRRILESADAPRAVHARALLRMGMCEEKLGQRKNAYETYRRLAAQFSDQSETVALAKRRLDAWSGPRNLSFEEGTVGKVPPGWFVPSLPKDADYIAELRRGEGCRSRSGCALVMVPQNVPRPVGNVMQSFSAAAYLGKYVRLRAWLRLERFFINSFNVRLPDPEDRAQMWFAIETANRSKGYSDNMDDRPVRSSDWTRCEIFAAVGSDARFINFGVMSIGGGRVWVDDVSFDVISRAEWNTAHNSKN